MDFLFGGDAVSYLDLVIKIALGAITLIVSYATTKLPAKWRAEAQAAHLAAEARLRESLHMAAVSGIDAGRKLGLEGASLIAYGLRHLLASVPEAVTELTGMNKEILQGPILESVVSRVPPGPRKVLETILAAKAEQASAGWLAPSIVVEEGAEPPKASPAAGLQLPR